MPARSDLDLDIRAHLLAGQPGGWKPIVSRYPAISRSTFWRAVRGAKRQMNPPRSPPQETRVWLRLTTDQRLAVFNDVVTQLHPQDSATELFAMDVVMRRWTEMERELNRRDPAS